MKRFLLPSVAILAVLLTIGVILSRRSGTVREELKDFAVKDTAGITKIFLSDRAGNSITLKRTTDKGWLVNDSIVARRESIKLLLEVIYRVDVRTRVSKSAYNTVIKDLAAKGIKCEIYTTDPSEPFKVYYVGSHTEDALGTFMMLANSTVPFVTEIPGFNGYLTPWYPTHISDWIDKVVFAYAPEDITKVSVTYPSFPDRSFDLSMNEGQFKLTSVQRSIVYDHPDTVAIQNFFDLLRSVPYESTDKLITDARKDSILQTMPVCIYSITDTKGKERSIRLHPMPVNEFSITLKDSLGNSLKYDLDRMLAYRVASKDWVTVQHFTFDPILRQFRDFVPTERKSTTPAK